MVQHEVHVWIVPLERSVSDTTLLARVLDCPEREKAERFVFERDRQSFIVAHAALRMILGNYLQADPGSLQFITNRYGKPDLAPGDQALRFNMAHSGGIALCAVTMNDDIGVDIEQIRPEFAELIVAREFFSRREVRELEQLGGDERVPGFFLCWTRKEAYIKARGMGLSLPLDSFDVSLAPGTPAVLLGVRDNARDRRDWHLQNLEIQAGYAAALAVAGKPDAVVTHLWQEELIHPSI